MLVVINPNLLPDRSGYVRSHPWGKTEYEEDGGEFCNFIKTPEKIREVLEDFSPHADQAAIQIFYELLEWVNREGGLLETTDCALRPPAPNEDYFKFQNVIQGRFEFLIRDHAANTQAGSVMWLGRMLSLYLQVERADCYNAVFEISFIPTDYVLLPENKNTGFRISVGFRAYGNGDSNAWESLLMTFNTLFEATKKLETAMTVPLPDFP